MHAQSARRIKRSLPHVVGQLDVGFVIGAQLGVTDPDPTPPASPVAPGDPHCNRIERLIAPVIGRQVAESAHRGLLANSITHKILTLFISYENMRYSLLRHQQRIKPRVRVIHIYPSCRLRTFTTLYVTGVARVS